MTTRTFILQDRDDPLNPQWSDALRFRVAGDQVHAEDLRGQFSPERLITLCCTPLSWCQEGEVRKVYPGEDDFFQVQPDWSEEAGVDLTRHLIETRDRLRHGDLHQRRLTFSQPYYMSELET